jgi:DNA-binding MarR family transcriptional regulator
MPPRAARSAATDATVREYASRGRECAYGNLRLITRVIGSVFDEALREVDLHAGQLPLLWAIVATEPVELGQLAGVTHTDPTTLSRTVEKLRKARLVDVRAGTDGRRKEVRVTTLGRERFAAAMPRWEAAQRKAAALLPLAEIRALARQVRRAAQDAS